VPGSESEVLTFRTAVQIVMAQIEVFRPKKLAAISIKSDPNLCKKQVTNKTMDLSVSREVHYFWSGA
jgi:hypothetical protein